MILFVCPSPLPNQLLHINHWTEFHENFRDYSLQDIKPYLILLSHANNASGALSFTAACTYVHIFY